MHVGEQTRQRLRRRYSQFRATLPGRLALPTRLSMPGAALRACLREGYSGRDLWRDMIAGLVVGLVTLPPALALGAASGVRPENGVYTAIVAGFVAALLGGSRVQVTGPSAAFVVIVAPVAQQYGLAGLALATAIAGALLMAMGLLRMGRVIEFIPYPVSVGFITGIAVMIVTLQLKDLLGLNIERMPVHTIDQLGVLWGAVRAQFVEPWLGGWSETMGPPRPFASANAIVGLTTLLLMFLSPRVVPRVPAVLVGLPLGALLAHALMAWLPGFEVVTIGDRFGTEAAPAGIPQSLPAFLLPWEEPGPLVVDAATGEERATRLEVTIPVMKSLIAAGFAIAMLGAMDSLLSAVVADGMTGKRHDPNAELFAQGAANLAAPFFAGFAASGAVVRTSTNILNGGRSPMAAMAHAGFLMVTVLLLAPWLGELPMASLAAVLIFGARNLVEVKHTWFLLRYAPAGDVAVLASCFVLTLMFDTATAVAAGVVLAAMLFMNRMAGFSTVRLVGPEHPALAQPLPAGIVLYDVGGPLFFAAANKALTAIVSGENVRVIVLDFTDVPTMDATGLVSIDSTVTRMSARGVFFVIAGVQPAVERIMARAGWLERHREMAVCGSVEAGLEIARTWLEAQLDPAHARPAL